MRDQEERSVPAPVRPFTCLEVLSRLDDYVDRALDSDEVVRVEQHLSACFECARRYRFEAALVAGIRERLHRVAAPPDLLRAVRARLERESGTIFGPDAL